MEILNEVLHSIGFNWHVALANFINFLIILYLLQRFVFKKVFAGLESRERIIKKGLEDAQAGQKLLHEARVEADDIIYKSKEEGEKVYKAKIDKAFLEAEDIKLKANQSADFLLNDLKVKISKAEETVERDFASRAPSIFAGLVRKTFANLDEETHNKLISSIVNK